MADVYYFGLDQKEKSLELLYQALLLRREIGDKAGEAETLHALAYLWHSQDVQRLAIFYDKQAINTRQYPRPRERNSKGLLGNLDEQLPILGQSAHF